MSVVDAALRASFERHFGATIEGTPPIAGAKPNEKVAR